MSKQAYVLQASCGAFLKGVSAWRKELTADLQEARIYTSKGAAHRSRNNVPRYGKEELKTLTAVPVKLVIDEDGK